MVRVGFIGGGQMATALIIGISKAGFCKPSDIFVSDTFADALKRLEAQIPGIKCCWNDNTCVAKNSDVLVLAVKPNMMQTVLDQVKPCIDASKTLVISVAAGVTISTIQQRLPPNSRVVRVMPNTPSLVGAGAAGFALGPHATAADEAAALNILQCVGKAWRVEEKLLDAVTGVSGSGPAWIFTVIESIADGGVLMGLPRDVSIQLAAQTTFGSAKLVLDQYSSSSSTPVRHTAQLRDSVTSPGGTTAAGLLALEEGQLRATLINTVRAATEKAIQLGKPTSKL